MLVTTTMDLPGWQIQRVCGEVFGLTVRRGTTSTQSEAGYNTALDGESEALTRTLINSRNEVIGRMLEAARAKGGNAVVGMRFDTSDVAEACSEICAYGTAVVAIPVDEGARYTAATLGYGHPGGAPQGPPAGPPVRPAPPVPHAPPPQGPPHGPPPGLPPQGPPPGPPPGPPQGPPPGPPPGPPQGPPPGPPQGPRPGSPAQGPPAGYPQPPGYSQRPPSFEKD